MSDGMIIVTIIVGVIIVIGVIFAFKSFSSPKSMAKQFESLQKTMEASEDTFKDMAKSATKLEKEILEENQDDLKDIANLEANINKDAVTTTANAVKDGLKDEK